MPSSASSLSPEEASLLTTLAAEGRQVFTIDDAYECWQGDPITPERLHRMVRKGWLERIERGRYVIIPFEAGPDREWSEDALVLASHLAKPSAVAYWSALHYWNLTEQIPRITYVQTTTRKWKRRIEAMGLRFQIVTITERKFFGLERVFVDDARVVVTDREKTLIDALDRPDLTGGIPEVAKALRTAVSSIDWDTVDTYLDRFGSGAVIKRLGYLVETLEVDMPDRDERLQAWMKRLTSGISKLDPSSAREPHRIATQWRLWINVDEAGLKEVAE